MPKLIKKYYGRILSVESKGTIEEGEWSWRPIFVGLRGVINIYESEIKDPGKHFIYIKGTDDYLRTGLGIMTEEDKIITLSTKNSVYKFQLLSEELLALESSDGKRV